jgi:hypothetical protein
MSSSVVQYKLNLKRMSEFNTVDDLGTIVAPRAKRLSLRFA